MHDDIVMQSQLESDLRRDVERIGNQPITPFQLYYQPIVSLSSGRISSFEALLRWQHPKRGLVSPAEFIPLAEETGLIVPIGRWVLREACRQMHTWQLAFADRAPAMIAVNLSGKQFLQLDLVEQIDQILQETGLKAGSLKLEITESVVMENSEEASVMLKQLKALGVQLLIDDFGTGYSSLSRLHSFPVNTLKIDRSFVSQMGTEGENSEIVQAIVVLAHHIGMNVTAEGVETAAQLTKLKELKCEEGQGYFFSRPLTSQAAQELIAAALQW
jgi:EAL domain-containing protein (putative c-di-GMP-specific phosphodiesterase class I)